jgi:hypothetical protein
MTSFVRLCPGLLFAVLVIPTPAAAQAEAACRFICDVEWKVEPTFTVENLANRHRVIEDGITARATREHVFETVLAVDMDTTIPRLGFTVEAITAPLSNDNEVEVEFEANLQWLTEDMLGGWVTSHFDIVNKLSPAERPAATKAYTNKLDFELDTAFHLFNWLPEGRWLRGLELETSLDYLATGIPKKGDVFADGTEYLDDASKWSLSLVIVVPVAPY